jgi:hypothetical protein
MVRKESNYVRFRASVVCRLFDDLTKYFISEFIILAACHQNILCAGYGINLVWHNGVAHVSHNI